MGRRPNALILEFFERGEKLDDSSNRYKHTCKRCGEKFPKGRIDSLQTHLVKKCPGLSTEERRKVCLQLNDISDNLEARNGTHTGGPSVELPTGNHTWTALETLAEVSRQVNLSENHDDRTQQNQSAEARSKTEETPRVDRFELQEQWTPDNPPLSYDARQQRDRKSKSLKSLFESKLTTIDLNQKLTLRRNSGQTLDHGAFASGMSDASSISPNLNMATAKSLAAAASARFVPSMLDPQLLGEGMPDLPQASMSLDADLSQSNNSLTFTHRDSQEGGAWPMLDGSGGTMYPDPVDFESNIEQQARSNGFPRTIAMNQGMTTEFSAEYGNGQKSNKPKVRGRFTPSRRKEVQEVRKRGACLRCRILKKPCSHETPCQTCRNVESPRSWKQTCSRVRPCDLLDMFSSGLHAVLAYHEVQAARGRINFQPSAIQVEASHYPETTVFATFRALDGVESLTERNIDPTLGLNGGLESIVTSRRILDNDNDDLPQKIEAYMKRMSAVFFEKEPSHFMNVTLSTALELSIQKQDPLLSKALELWATVHMLVDHELRWVIYEKNSFDTGAGQGTPIPDDVTYQLLCMQLNAAVEKKALVISRNVMADLEKRIFGKFIAEPFETFLAVLILLNCVEKCTWLYQSWEQDYLKARWPLDRNAGHYAQQGDRFTELVDMLLQLRHIPPKIYHRLGDGLLAVDGDAAQQGYFEKLQLSYATVLDKTTNSAFDPADSRCYELRFCSKILLPAN